MKKIIRLTESDLHRLIKESVKRILKEGYETDITQLIKRYEQLRHNPKYRINKQLKGEANEILKQIEEYIRNERQDLINQYNLFLDDVYNSGNYIVIEPDSNSIFKTPSYTEKDKPDNVRPIPSMVNYALQYLR